jgi:hypothetical protein
MGDLSFVCCVFHRDIVLGGVRSVVICGHFFLLDDFFFLSVCRAVCKWRPPCFELAFLISAARSTRPSETT